MFWAGKKQSYKQNKFKQVWRNLEKKSVGQNVFFLKCADTGISLKTLFLNRKIHIVEYITLLYLDIVRGVIFLYVLRRKKPHKKVSLLLVLKKKSWHPWISGIFLKWKCQKTGSTVWFYLSIRFAWKKKQIVNKLMEICSVN